MYLRQSLLPKAELANWMLCIFQLNSYVGGKGEFSGGNLISYVLWHKFLPIARIYGIYLYISSCNRQRGHTINVKINSSFYPLVNNMS